jgi:NADPH:quinone reductase-like Zn-dependent oxidoreductase
MKAIVQTAYGAPDVLVIKDVPRPMPRENEVLVKVHATTVTSGDARLRAFRIPAAFWLPARLVMGITQPRKNVLGCEFAGEVVAIGRNVTRFRVGDRVFGLHVYGAYAEYKTVPDSAAIATMPARMSYEEAAAIPFGGLTALYFLRRANIQPGQKVLVNGASGAVGSFAVQLAKHFGAPVTAVCSAANAALVRDLGASEVIDYTTTDFAKTGRRYDVIFDTMDNVSPRRFRQATTVKGILLAVAGGGLAFIRAALSALGGGRRVIAGMSDESQSELEVLRGLWLAGALRSTVDRCFEFEDIGKAHALVDSGRKRGAVIVHVVTPAKLALPAPASAA